MLRNHEVKGLAFAAALLVVGFAGRLAGGQEAGTEPPEGLRTHRPNVYALTHCRVIPAPGSRIEEGVIVIRDEKIEAVGSVDQVAIPADAECFDLAGKTVYAGFIDAYSTADADESGLSKGSPYWNSNIRPQIRLANEFTPDDDANEAYREQGVVARLVAPSTGIVKGQSLVALTGEDDSKYSIVSADTAMHVRLTVQRRFGSSESGPRYPNSPMGAVALARQSLYDAIWYREAWAAASADADLPRPERNDALQAWLPFLAGDRLVIFDTVNELYALRADRFAREFSLQAALLGSGNEYRRLEAIRATGRPVIVPINFPEPPDVSTEEVAANASLESLMHWDHAPENPGRLVEAGVTIALTANGLDSVDDFVEKIQKAVARGLEPHDALAALTVNPAEICSVSDQLGTIARGKLACLVVSEGDLFSEGGEITETWVRGTRYEMSREPAREVAGHWQMEIEYLDGKPNLLHVKVDSSRGQLSGEVSASLDSDAEQIRMDRVTLTGVNLGGSFPAYALDQDGIVRFSSVIELDGDSWVGIGHLIWPDGKRASIRLTPQADPDASPSDWAANEAGGADGQGTPASDAGEESEEVGSSFPVNYPLGAHGVIAPAAAESVIFRDATVWTCGPAGILEQADVHVVDGKIVAVGTDLEVGDGCLEVDASGRHLTPGIIDCHSHMASDGGINESGQGITAEVRIGDFIDCDDVTIYRQLAGGVTASNILHGSANPIGGQNQVIKLRWGHLDEAMKMQEAPLGIKFALGENVTRSSRDSRGERYPATRMGVEQLFRDEFQAAVDYHQSLTEWQRHPTGIPPRRDLELEAIAEIVSGDRWIHCHSYRQDEILAFIRVLDDFGITIGTFQHILEGYKVADAMAEHGAMASAFSDWWNYKMEVKDAIPYAGALMHEAGVVVSFNSDDGELATHLNHEAAKAVKYGGVSPEEALKFVTLNPAKQLRIDEYVGSIEIGKHADLVLWSGSPLSNFTRCEQTWIEGAKYFDRDWDQQQQLVIQEQRNVLIQKVLASGQKMRPRGSDDGDPSRLWPREDIYCRAHENDLLRFESGSNGWHQHGATQSNR